MPSAGLFALLDDITTILDDVAAMSKVAAEKTVALAGDDLAVNAEGLIGHSPARELPIVGKVALGSLANKVVLIPLALALPAAWLTPVLMCGGTFLCFEGLHKVLHKSSGDDDAHKAQLLAALRAGPVDLKEAERKTVRKAITTDVVLSAEIIAVALSSVRAEPLLTRALVLGVVGIGMTLAIYGLVSLIVKLDDIGLHLQRQSHGTVAGSFGRLLVERTPTMMKLLSALGTIAMFLVGGGIVLHGLPWAAAFSHHIEEVVPDVVGLRTLASLGLSLVAGLAVGAVAVGIESVVRRAVARWRA
ncbi:MAG: DUF808 family protein [Myxococcota bacterium]